LPAAFRSNSIAASCNLHIHYVATDLIEVDVDNPSDEAIAKAALALSRGAVIGIPTDALYSIMADPLNLQAVGRVFYAKGRDYVRSLPLIVNDVLMAEDLAKELSSRFYILARHFWPGPLTMIVPASAKVPLKVTGNTGRLALRQVKSKLANALVDRVGHALIATSANISGEPTCTNGIELFAAMDGRIDLVLDGGLCTGPGATTVDITEPYWRVIKEGAIPTRELAERLRGS
jgi:L-threonylcarbamoyladenylate synthase